MADMKIVRLVSPNGITVGVREDRVDRLPPGFKPVEVEKPKRTTKAAVKSAATTE